MRLRWADRAHANRRAGQLGLVGIVLAALALRLVNLAGRPLWYDEAFAVLYADRSLSEIMYGTLTQVQGAAADVHPLLYYFTLHFWMRLAGDSPLAARLPSVLLGVGAVVAAWGLARELFDAGRHAGHGARVELLAAALTAGSPFLIAYSQEARMYALLGFWSTAALWAWARAARSGHWRAWAAFVVCGALALYSHNLGFLTFMALGIYVIIRAALSQSTERRTAWRLTIKTALAGLAMVILFSPWLMVTLTQLGKIQQSYWVTRPDLKTLVQTLIVFSFDFENAVFPRGLIAPALFGAVLLLAVVVVQLARRNPPGNSQRPGAGLLATLAFVPVLALYLVSQWRPVYIIRGLLPAATCYLIFAAWAVGQMPRAARYGLLAILGGLAALVMFSYYGYAGFPRGPFARLDAELRAQLAPGDVIVHSNKLSFFPAHYYDRTLPQVFLSDPPGSGSDTLARPTQEALGLFPTDLESATGTASRVWLVIFRQALQEVPGAHPHVAWLTERFAQTETVSLGDVDAILFVRKGRPE